VPPFLAQSSMLHSTAALALLLLEAGSAAAICDDSSPFAISDEKMGAGESALGMKVLTNQATGERVEVIWESGGRTERALLRSPTTGLLRDVIQTHEGDAVAVRNNEHWAGTILLPFANRIRNGTYSFFGQTYYLPRNEDTPGVRTDALHGFLANRSLEVTSTGCDNNSAYVSLGYRFDGTSTPGWPFKLDVEVTYTLSAGSLTIGTRATSLEASHAVPFFNSWHPYFAVGSVPKALVEFDSCVPESLKANPAWNHITMGAGAPRNGDLIPTGEATAWTQFDGKTPIGGTEELPTYMDDEFKSALPSSGDVQGACGPWYKQRIHDVGGDNATLVLFADRQHHVFQIFTGAKETWGWDAIALEPMSGLADAYNNGDGLTVLWPGETYFGQFGASIE